MSENTSNALETLLGGLQDSLDTQGVCFLESAPKTSGTVKGKSLKEGDATYCYPKVELDKRSLPGSPVALWFVKDDKKGKIKMEFKLAVGAQVAGAKAYPLTNVKVSLSILDDAGNKTSPVVQSFSSPITLPQTISGTVYFTLQEFTFIEQRIEKGFNSGNPQLLFKWDADVAWVPLADYTKFMEEKDSSKRKSMHATYRVSGELAANVDYTNEYLYQGVKGLLNWEQVIIEGSDYNIWFKDAMEANAYYFLPQIFRIKANPVTNAPEMSFSLVRDPGADPTDPRALKVRMSFEMVPYYHPRAERDLYREIKKRSGGNVKICNIKYGGYEDARFCKREEKSIDALFHQLGVKSLNDDVIKTSPDSSFNICLESSLDAFNGIRQKLLEGGIHIGNVIISVKEGMKDTIREIPIEAKLDLMKVAGTNIGINVMESTEKKYRFPHEVKLTNNGKYKIEIGGCEMSMISEKKGTERDVFHELKTDSSWPLILAPGESKGIALQESDMKQLNKKNTFLGFNYRKYWTTLICQPYSVHLCKEDLNGIIEDIEDHASSDIKMWELELVLRFDWSSLSEVETVEIEVRNDDYAKDEIVRMNRGTESVVINMSANLTAIRQAQLITNRKFQYRIRAVLKDGTTPWSSYQENEGNSLYVFSKAITELMNSNK